MTGQEEGWEERGSGRELEEGMFPHPRRTPSAVERAGTEKELQWLTGGPGGGRDRQWTEVQATACEPSLTCICWETGLEDRPGRGQVLVKLGDTLKGHGTAEQPGASPAHHRSEGPAVRGPPQPFSSTRQPPPPWAPGACAPPGQACRSHLGSRHQLARFHRPEVRWKAQLNTEGLRDTRTEWVSRLWALWVPARGLGQARI